MVESFFLVVVIVLVLVLLLRRDTVDPEVAPLEPPALPLDLPDDRLEVNLDFAGGVEVQACRCVCGFECDTVEAIIAHARSHGARSVVVTPEHRRPRQ